MPKDITDITVKELVGPDVYKQWGENAIQFIDVRIIRVAQWLRTYTGKGIVVNNWVSGGVNDERGLRNPNTTTGAKFSQHKFGRALDFNIVGLTSDQVRQIIRDNWETLKALGLTTIELGTQGWVHIDCRYTGLETLYEVPFQ